jgi:hypothetical protein
MARAGCSSLSSKHGAHDDTPGDVGVRVTSSRASRKLAVSKTCGKSERPAEPMATPMPGHGRAMAVCFGTRLASDRPARGQRLQRRLGRARSVDQIAVPASRRLFPAVRAGRRGPVTEAARAAARQRLRLAMRHPDSRPSPLPNATLPVRGRHPQKRPDVGAGRQTSSPPIKIKRLLWAQSAGRAPRLEAGPG